jgi:hypothetical protein
MGVWAFGEGAFEAAVNVGAALMTSAKQGLLLVGYNPSRL